MNAKHFTPLLHSAVLLLYSQPYHMVYIFRCNLDVSLFSNRTDLVLWMKHKLEKIPNTFILTILKHFNHNPEEGRNDCASYLEI